MKIFLLSVFSFFIQSIAWAQHWKEVTLPAVYNEVTPYFLDENTGFVFESYKGLAKLSRTTDGGVSWTYLPFFDSLGPDYALRQIYFETSSKGYAVGGAGIYETTDTGNTWRSIYPGKIFFNSVYASGGKIFAYEGVSADWGALIESANGGNTWDTILPPAYYYAPADVDYPLMPYVFGNGDSTVFTVKVNTPSNLSLMFSTNNGKSWTIRPMDIEKKTFTAGLYSFPHSQELLRTCADLRELPNNNVDVYFILHSSDFGMHWDTVFHPVEIGAWIAGNGCILYVSKSDETGVHGLYRSVDRGQNWEYVPGPNFTEIDDIDFHNLSVMGNGAIVYAGDVNYGLTDKFWKTTDGGDGNLSSFNTSILFSSSRIINDSVNVTIHLPIYFHHSATIMNDVDMIMHYPTTSLNLLSTTLYNGKSFDVKASEWPGRAALHFATSDLNAAPDSLLGYANFQWIPFEYTCSEIDFDSIDTHNSEGPCPVSSEGEPFKGIIGSYAACGLLAVADQSTTSVPLDFIISSNPATDILKVTIKNNHSLIQYELFNSLGIIEKSGVTTGHSFQIDVPELITGNYYLRIRRGNQMPLTKQVVIIK